jgi:methionine biosynthesis protein MetW
MAQLDLVHPLDFGQPAARADHLAIAQLVNDGARVLDVGCGDGALMQLLIHERGAQPRGLEADPANVHNCVSRGLSVVQSDVERDLDRFPSATFDYVIFSHTLLRLRRPLAALKSAARIGERIIVSIENTGYWRRRVEHMVNGRLAGWDGAALASVRDLARAARDLRLTLECAVPLSRGLPGPPFAKIIWQANWFAEEAVFLLRS